MDTSFDSLKQNAYNAGSEAANITADAPGLLTQLKQNLVGIFAKDNPIMKARETALTDYLGSNSASRVATLPQNLPMVEGSNLTLSPTQQDAITSARSAAALAPLAGLNDIIKAQYGTIGDMVTGAGSIYDAMSRSAGMRATNALDLYKAAIAEEEAKKKAAGSEGIDLPSIMAMIQKSLGLGDGTDNGPSGFFNDEPTPPAQVIAPRAVPLPPGMIDPQLQQALKGVKLTQPKTSNTTLNIAGGGTSPFANLFGGQKIKL
jgi:hypothetical protein